MAQSGDTSVACTHIEIQTMRICCRASRPCGQPFITWGSWRSCNNFSMNKAMFNSNIIGCSLSGLEVFCLSQADSARIHRTTFAIARRILGKPATFLVHDDRSKGVGDLSTAIWRSISNDAICGTLGILPTTPRLL